MRTVTNHRKIPCGARRLVVRCLGALALASALGACQMNGATSGFEGIGFRQARFTEVEALRGYRACRDDALRLDEEARRSSNPGQYLASARLLESCEANLGPDAARIADEERMRAYALAIQNQVKGGDLSAARADLERFKSAFPGQDLYLADGASFIYSYGTLLQYAQVDPYAMTAANVGKPLRDEIRRVRHWQNN